MTISQHDEATKALPPRFEAKTIILNFKDRQDLYDRINLRVDMMEEMGLFEEVEGLLQGGLEEGSTAMQAIGYKETAAYFAGRLSREEALDKMSKAAEAGRDSTVDMVAKIGRSSRLGERSRGVMDAGSASCCLLLTTMAETVKEIL